MESIEENEARLRSKIAVFNPVLVAERLDQALEHFLQEHPNIPRDESLAMWRASGG
jgi:hypothetical protein